MLGSTLYKYTDPNRSQKWALLRQDAFSLFLLLLLPRGRVGVSWMTSVIASTTDDNRRSRIIPPGFSLSLFGSLALPLTIFNRQAETNGVSLVLTK